MFKVDMSYRKRSLDMPMSGEPQSVKYPRADSGAATAAAAAAAATPPAAGRDPSSALPPIRSLPEFNRARYGALAQPQQSPAASTGVIPPIRHLHISTPSPISPSHERSFPHHLALPPPPVQTSAAYPVITHSQPRQQQQSQQHTQVGYEFHQKLQQQQGSRISGGYPGTAALPQPSPPSNMDSGTGGHNPFGQGSSPLSSLKSANSPPATMGIMGTGSGSNNGDHRVSRMDLLSNAATIASSAPLSSPVAPVPAAAATRGTATVSSRVAVAAAKTTPEAAVMAQDHEGGTGADTIKVARNWSRDETLSLVRAIGRHYESLKRCKTNQERSNVWHRIHKEHSGQFPGRSKKASQDRWGKVLSDYKDVVVHNKEKGAARWTFDFFKEVANIVDGDSQYMDSAGAGAVSNASSSASASTYGGAPVTDMGQAQVSSATPGDVGARSQKPADDAAAYAIGSSYHAVETSRPLSHHRMSEPNLKIANESHSPAHSPHFQSSSHSHSLSHGQYPHHHQQHPSQPGLQKQPQQRPAGRDAQHSPSRLSASSVPGSANPHSNHRFSPTRRTSFPQSHTFGAVRGPAGYAPEASSSSGSNKNSSSRNTVQQPPLMLSSPPPLSGGATPFQGFQRSGLPQPQQQGFGLRSPLHSSSVLPAIRSPQQMSQRTAGGAGSSDSVAMSPGSAPSTAGGVNSPPQQSQFQAPLPSLLNQQPEQACRYVLEMLELQVRRIDEQQDCLVQLRDSTNTAISKVEHLLQTYMREQ